MFINNFDPVAFSLFSLEFRWYSLAYIFGILTGWILAKRIFIKDDSLKKIFIKIRFELENSFINILPKILTEKVDSISQFRLKKRGEKDVYFSKKKSLSLLKFLPKKWNTDTKELKELYEKKKLILDKV